MKSKQASRKKGDWGMAPRRTKNITGGLVNKTTPTTITTVTAKTALHYSIAQSIGKNGESSAAGGK